MTGYAVVAAPFWQQGKPIVCGSIVKMIRTHDIEFTFYLNFFPVSPFPPTHEKLGVLPQSQYIISAKKYVISLVQMFRLLKLTNQIYEPSYVSYGLKPPRLPGSTILA